MVLGWSLAMGGFIETQMLLLSEGTGWLGMGATLYIMA